MRTNPGPSSEPWLSERVPVEIAPDGPPLLITAISTEEDFDWRGPSPFSTRTARTDSAAEIGRAQEVFDRCGIRPVYLIDHPIARDGAASAALKAILDAGRCEIGAHLHPWVTPPYEEEPSVRNSFPGNLAPELEEKKLAAVTAEIARALGTTPRIYQAGRYGCGPATPAILRRHGFEVDLSLCPPYDFRREGGPDFSRLSAEPFWYGRRGGLLAVPITGAYVGWMRAGSRTVYRLASRPFVGWMHAPAILARLRAVDRLRLSPEGFSPADHRRLTRALLARGQRVFVLSFHSPSLLPGCTPYVQSERDRESLLDACRRYFDFFLGELGGRALTPSELRLHLLSGGGSAA